ncbi:hypothetical protein CDD83_1118 [Cordyceps sp. RAO-2017]|nr:hypothetical protein CDD83_1118 [Cordyceps sp. RAO-2017]
MRAYRIGRKPTGPWANMTPPIRGGHFRRLDTLSPCLPPHDMGGAGAAAAPGLLVPDQADAAWDASSDMSATSSSDLERAVRRRPPGKPAADRIRAGGLAAESDDDDEAPALIGRCPATYTDWAVQQGVEQGLRDYPSLDPAVQQGIVDSYRALHRRVVDEGLYDCPYREYAKEMARYTCLFAAFLVALHHAWYLTSAVFLGLFWHQIMFTAHDAGHRAISQIFVVDTLIGMFIADFCCGLSIGWWKSSHNVHHLVTNQPEHDPDIQNVPLFATCPSFFKSLTSTYYNFRFVWDAAADALVPFQKYTYYPVMGIARFNLYLLSWLHVLSPKASALSLSSAWWIRPTEIAFMSCYWFLFGYCLLLRTLPTWPIRVAFVLVSHIVTMPLHVQITLSHWGMSTAHLGESESFAQRQLRTTMDVDCPPWLDFVHGGLQFQAVHHLFPRLPRHNLRRAQVLTREFCQKTGVPYTILGFVDGNQKVLGRLQDVSDQLKILVKCQKYMAETGESGLH